MVTCAWRLIPAIAALSMAMVVAQPAAACTRVVYLGDKGEVITARSMDWKEDVATNLWVFPRGMQRSGQGGPNTVTWTSKYGSVTASGYDISTTDGMNEKGLTAQLLWLVESQYPAYRRDKPAISLAAWAQYALDNFATVDEAVTVLAKEPFIVVTDSVPGQQRLAALHLSLSDAGGDSAIFEYIDGKLVIHHGRQYQVMTNSPAFSEQLALNSYWEQIGGTVMLPGTNRSSDRFARAAFYINAIPKSEDPDVAVASVFSVVRNTSVPFGITSATEPNISSTRWRTVADQKRLLYFFESALTPNTFWVDMKKLDLDAGTGKVLKLDLGKDQRNTFDGEVGADLKPAAPFSFLGI